MSRTKRHIPHYCGISNYQKTWMRLSELGYGQYEIDPDPRHKLENGHDNGKGQSYYHDYESRGYGNQWAYKSRRFFKRRFHKSARRVNKQRLQNMHEE